jgi:glucan 1,3-beta-glucosidase
VPAYVYVPAGTYLIASSIQMLVNTMLVGDPLNVPTLKAASSLGTNPIIQGFDQSRNLQSTTNFYIGLRNLVLDTTGIDTSTEAIALNWPVSQACTLSNVQFNMPDYSSHVGVDMNGGGSGTVISDLVSLCRLAVDEHCLTAVSLSPVEPSESASITSNMRSNR